MAHILLTEEKLSADRAVSHVAAPEFGAVVTFVGSIRNNSRGDRVRYLVYESYRAMAEKELASIIEQAEARWPVLCSVEHRLGRVEIGDAGVIIVVASTHRADAYEANRWIMDAIKQTVPIWKKEYTANGVRWVEGSDVVSAAEA